MKKNQMIALLLMAVGAANVQATISGSDAEPDVLAERLASVHLEKHLETLESCLSGINKKVPPEFGTTLFQNPTEETAAEEAFQYYLEIARSIRGEDVRKSLVSAIVTGDKAICYGRSFVNKDECVVDLFIDDIQRKINIGMCPTVVDIGAGHGFATLRIAEAFKNKYLNIVSLEINPELVQHLTNLSTLHSNRDVSSSIEVVNADIAEAGSTGITSVSDHHSIQGLLALNVLHFVDPHKWPAFFANCSRLLGNGAKLFLTVSCPSSHPEYQTKSSYDFNKRNGKEWPGHMVRFDYTYEGGKKYGVAYAPYEDRNKPYGLGKPLGASIDHKTYPRAYFGGKLDHAELKIVAIPCLVFDLEEFKEKLSRYARQFRIEDAFGIDENGLQTSDAEKYASIGAILVKAGRA